MGDDRITKLSVEVEHIKETLDEVRQVVGDTSITVATHVAKEQVLRDTLQSELQGIRKELSVYNASLIDHMARTGAVETTNELLAAMVENMEARIRPIEDDRKFWKKLKKNAAWWSAFIASLVGVTAALWKWFA